VNAERSDDELPAAGTTDSVGDPAAARATPGQRASTRRAAPRRAAATDPASADPTRADPTRAMPIGADPAMADPASAGYNGAALPTTPAAGLPPIPMPADPPTTEIRGTVSAGSEPTTRAPATPAPVPVPTNIYRARRPGVAVLLVIPAVVVGVLLVRALVIAALEDPMALGGFIASVCALVSLPFLVAGVYGLVSGAAHGAEHYGFKVWARPPLAYLLVGLAFVVAAAIAVA
jgi:hypothetical protein